MRPVLILKVGDARPSLIPERGDYQDWIRRLMGLGDGESWVVDPRKDERMPPPESLSGVVVTGSSAMVTARPPWSVRAGGWLRSVVTRGTPLLGICYGHQLLADVLDGEIGPAPSGREIGTIEVRLRPEAEGDALFGGMPREMLFQATHCESVLRLPTGARWLVDGDRDPLQGYALGERCWCVQFHPEIDASAIKVYITDRADLIASEGLDVDGLIAGLKDSDHGAMLLRRFAGICREEG